MKPIPRYKHYAEPSPPRWSRWIKCALAITAGALLLSPFIAEADRRVVMLQLGLLLAGIGGILLLMRLLVWRFSVHNHALWQQEVAGRERAWWREHRQSVALGAFVLAGPAGVAEANWKGVLEKQSRPPVPLRQGSGSVLRLLNTFTHDRARREAHLMNLVVNQWQTQGSRFPSGAPLACYWAGSQACWQVLCDHLQALDPTLSLPAVPQAWQGMRSQQAIISRLHREENPDSWVLCAGSRCTEAQADSTSPAGEAAFLWLLQRQGDIRLTRGEYCEASDLAGLAAARALQQAQVADKPSHCVLFTHPDSERCDPLAWDFTYLLQDSYWGDIGPLAPVVLQTLAAIQTKQSGQATAWLATDPHYPLTLGIVISDGQDKRTA